MPKFYETTSSIGSLFGVDRGVVLRYIKEFSEIGMCKYNAEEENEKRARNKRKIILQYSKDGIFIKEWESITEASKQLQLTGCHISKCAKGEIKTHGGFVWKYKL